MGSILGLTLPGPSLLYRAIAILLLFVGVLTYGYVKGISHEQAKAAIAQAKSAEIAVKAAKEQNHQNAMSYKRLADAFGELEGKYQQLRKGVRSHVSESDHSCKLSNGWVLLHDAAASGTVPGPPGVAEADSSAVTAVEALEGAIISNYQEYNKCREQVIEFNQWYESQKKIFEGAGQQKP